MKKNAFTLIELLVVIAIIAILAAILFPVFAQAKLAAKKTMSLSNIKQVNLASILYQGDYDDTYALAFGNDPTQYGWDNYDLQNFPYNWVPNEPGWATYAQMSWPTLLLPYLKSTNIYQDPVQVVRNTTVWWSVGHLTPSTILPLTVNMTFNGLLASYSATSVNQPSQLPSFWPGFAKQSLNGFSLSDPQLNCYDATQACKYVPTASTCNQNGGAINGSTSSLLDAKDFAPTSMSAWMYGKGWNWAFADGYAKWRASGGTIYPGKTDYRADPYLMYNPHGVANAGYYDDYACHALLFRPDFDFTNFGTPTILVSGYGYDPNE